MRVSPSCVQVLAGISMLSAVACGGSVSSSALPGNGHAIRCEKGLDDCVRRAQSICKDMGFTVVGGRETNKLLGGSSSSYRKLSTQGELQVYCGDYAPPTCQPSEQDAEAVYQLSQTEPSPAPEPAPAAVAPVPAAPVPHHLCMPGATQQCVGPGACGGGQICNADGMSFGSCDCGPSAAVPLATPATPAASKP